MVSINGSGYRTRKIMKIMKLLHHSILICLIIFVVFRFMESELELHEEIQKLHVLATAPEYYGVFVRLNSVATCLNLLNHENSGEFLIFNFFGINK